MYININFVYWLYNNTTMKRIYNVNDDYFETINCEQKAYWLGFLCADGWINKRSTGQDRLVLDISIKDKEHLYIYKKDLSFEGNIKDYIIKSGEFKGYQHSSVSITSQKLVDSLSKYGCTPNKSLTLTFPDIPIKWINHFVRGYFDGDGSVFISNEKHWRSKKISPVIHYRFIGTKKILNDINTHIGLDGYISQPKGKAYELAYKRNKKLIPFYIYLYTNATVYLKRKQEIFSSHIQERCSETIISQLNKVEGIVRV